MEVTALDEEKVEFEMRGISPAIANAFRRILISEVPTMAIEKVFVVNNTSIIRDEVFAHRLGLVPIRADPRLFEYRSDSEAPSERNTIVFKMNVKCYREQNADGTKGALVNEMVYSNSLKWLPNGSELPGGGGQVHLLHPVSGRSPRAGEQGGGNVASRRWAGYWRSSDHLHRPRRHPPRQDGGGAGD